MIRIFNLINQRVASMLTNNHVNMTKYYKKYVFLYIPVTEQQIKKIV